MKSTEYQDGYAQALLDVAEKLNNAEANGETVHHNYEIIGQLDMLANEAGVSVTHEQLLEAGR